MVDRPGLSPTHCLIRGACFIPGINFWHPSMMNLSSSSDTFKLKSLYWCVPPKMTLSELRREFIEIPGNVFEYFHSLWDQVISIVIIVQDHLVQPRSRDPINLSPNRMYVQLSRN